MTTKCLAPEHCLKPEDGSPCPACPTEKEPPSSGSERRPCSPGLRRALDIVSDIAGKECRNAHPDQKDIIRWVTNRIEKQIRSEISSDEQLIMPTPKCR